MRWLVGVVITVIVLIGVIWFVGTCADKNGGEPIESVTETLEEAGEKVQDAAGDAADYVTDAVD